MTPKIRPLNPDLIHQANSNSMNGKRGDLSAESYGAYCKAVLEWPISDEKKQKILDALYKKRSELLRHEAAHVSVIVAGPSNYNSRKLDHSDQILRLSAEFVDWFKDLEEQVKDGSREYDKINRLVEMVEWCDGRDQNPMSHLAALAPLDTEKFIELYERMQPKYRWRKNSNVVKLYEQAKDGTLRQIVREVFFEDSNFKAYTEGDRAYIKFLMRPRRQLMTALKSRGWWWNSLAGAWSTYLNKLDKEWVSGISERYSAYI